VSGERPFPRKRNMQRQKTEEFDIEEYSAIVEDFYNGKVLRENDKRQKSLDTKGRTRYNKA
jgi:hypothetical protein